MPCTGLRGPMSLFHHLVTAHSGNLTQPGRRAVAQPRRAHGAGIVCRVTAGAAMRSRERHTLECSHPGYHSRAVDTPDRATPFGARLCAFDRPR